MAEVSVVLALNDLEARRIDQLARARGCDVRTVQVDWGGRIDAADPALKTLKDTVILVELPNLDLETRLRAEGRQVHVVDHHLYVDRDCTILDRRRPRSSLEQVAALLNALPLSAEDRLVSANDRDFIPGLARQADAETVRRVRLDELAVRLGDRSTAEAALDTGVDWLRKAEASGRLRRLATGRGNASDPELWLIRAPTSLRPCLGDALTWWRHAEHGTPLTQPIPFLAVFDVAEPESRPSGLFLSGYSTWAPMLGETIEGAAGGGAGNRLTLWMGGGEGCFFGATDDLGTEAAAVEALADRLLNELLTGHRPLVSWRSHFLQTLLTGPAGAAPKPDQTRFQPEDPNEAHRVYFLSHLRDALVPKVDDRAYDLRSPRQGGPLAEDRALSLRSYAWPAPGLSLSVTMPAGEAAGAWTVRVPIRTIRVHLFLETLTVVEWECAGGVPGHDQPGPAGLEYKEANPGLWRQLLTQDSPAPIGTVASLLEFNWAARQVYSPFQNAGESAAIALVRDDGTELGRLDYGVALTAELTGWFAALLTEIEASFSLPELALVFDERARLVTGMVGVGAGPRTETGRTWQTVVLARLRGADRYGADHFYDAAHAVAEMQPGWYKRFINHDTHYLISDHSFTMSAHGWFAPRFILPDHVPHLYRRLFLIGLVYSATLAASSRDAGAAALEPADRQAARFRALRRRFQRFANGLYAETVSSQIQGRELFDLIRTSLPIQRDFDALTAQIERSDGFLDAMHQERDRRFTLRLERVGFLGLILAITIGFLGMDLVPFTNLSLLVRLAIFAGTFAGFGLLFLAAVKLIDRRGRGD